MKTLQKYINEKLIINKNTKIEHVDWTNVDVMININFEYKYDSEKHNFNISLQKTEIEEYNDDYIIKNKDITNGFIIPNQKYRMLGNDPMLYSLYENRYVFQLQVFLSPKYYNDAIKNILNNIISSRGPYKMSIEDFFKEIGCDIPFDITKIASQKQIKQKYKADQARLKPIMSFILDQLKVI